MIKGVHLASSLMSGSVPCSKQKLKIFAWPPELAQCIIFRPESSVEFNFLKIYINYTIAIITYKEISKYALNLKVERGVKKSRTLCMYMSMISTMLKIFLYK